MMRSFFLLSETDTIKGRIIGQGPGVIYIETEDLGIYTLDRFAVIRRLYEDIYLFHAPHGFKEKDNI